MDRWVCSIHMSSMPQAETLKSKCLQLAAANLSEVQVSRPEMIRDDRSWGTAICKSEWSSFGGPRSWSRESSWAAWEKHENLQMKYHPTAHSYGKPSRSSYIDAEGDFISDRGFVYQSKGIPKDDSFAYLTWITLLTLQKTKKKMRFPSISRSFSSAFHLVIRQATDGWQRFMKNPRAFRQPCLGSWTLHMEVIYRNLHTTCYIYNDYIYL